MNTRSVLECVRALALSVAPAKIRFIIGRSGRPIRNGRRLAHSKTCRIVVTALVVLAASHGLLHAQTYGIDWFTIGGGGGTSTGGVYTVSGTVGQPDAGSLSGGQYSLDGGFWSVIATVQTPDAPFLSIERLANGSVRVFWPLATTGFALDQSLAVGPSASWSSVPFPYQTNATQISVTVPSPIGSRFYRLRHP